MCLHPNYISDLEHCLLVLLVIKLNFCLAWARAIFFFTKLMVFLMFQGGVDRDTKVRRWLQRINGPFSFHPKETSAGVNPPFYLYSAFNNTNCVKATAQYQNRNIYELKPFHY